MFPKAAAVATVATALVVLGGCSSISGPPASSRTTAKTTAKATPIAAPSTTSSPRGLISLITSSLDNPYWTAEADAVRTEASRLGYDVTVRSYQQDSKKEAALIDRAINSRSVAIILDNAGGGTSVGDVQKADAAGIPVFLVNAPITKKGVAKAHLMSDNAQGAALGARQFSKAMKGRGKYVELVGLSSDTNAALRSRTYKKVLSRFPHLVRVQQEIADWDQKKGFDKMRLMLKAHPDIKGVISGNDQMALGAIAAINQGAKKRKIVVGGFDGSPEAASAVQDGTLAYTVLQPVVRFSTQAVVEADRYLRTGKTGARSERQSFACVLITRDNIDRYTSFGLRR